MEEKNRKRMTDTLDALSVEPKTAQRSYKRAGVVSMAAAICVAAGAWQITGLAASADQTAKDGTYVKSDHVARTAEDDVDENEWHEYDLDVRLNVSEGKFSEITVTPGAGYDAENDSYFSKAVSKSKGIQKQLTGKPATEESINSWDTVSGATRTSDAVRRAALAAIHDAPAADSEPAPTPIDTTKLEASVAEAEKLSEKEYTADSWRSMQEKLAAAKAALEKKESQEIVDQAADQLNTSIRELKKAEAAKDTYVLMNIPYAQFYSSDRVVGADTVSSATKVKTRSTLVAGSYHENSDGTDIAGVIFPVKISDPAVLDKYTQVTDDNKLSITVKMKGKEITTDYNGKDALFESPSYSYYILKEQPSYYKEAVVKEDGSLSFGSIKGAVAQPLAATVDFSTVSRYGDYQMNVDGLPESVHTVHGVVISTREGDTYGLRHLENIWRKTELAWSTGIVTSTHGNTLNYKDYEKMMGQTINRVTYYTDSGIYEIPVNQYVPVKFNGSLSAENADVSSGKVNVAVADLPGDYQPVYTVEGLEEVNMENGILTYRAEGAQIGKYTLRLSDKSGKYADLTTAFELTTQSIPIDFDSEKTALVPAKDYSDDNMRSYVKNIVSVTVDGKEYAATGKRAVKLIKEDGVLDVEAEAFKNAEPGHAFLIRIKASGYAKDYEFTYRSAQNIVKTSELEEAIKQAETYREENYTSESWNVLQEALISARDALEKKESSRSVDEATHKLNDAVKALVKKVVEDETPSAPPVTPEEETTGTVKPVIEKTEKPALNQADAVASAKNKNGSAADSNPAGKKVKAAKTGDVTGMSALFGVALSSLGIGAGHLVSRRNKKR